MAAFEDLSPTYISARSSDFILSDIRPIKLKLDALRSVNAFLDELLWIILNLSRSMSTDRLKASLLKIIPTTLGKEALLEAEVELKAYWERTGSNPRPGSGFLEGEDFPLQWSFELLRLKCEAYSTLNDSDEDSTSESRLSERMRDLGFTRPPPAPLVAPAALYLTAIIEYICEHVLSNVSRVVARDSSRTAATLNDFFVALCEDGTVYATFKSMKVYDQIENLSKSTKPRRSKSFSHDKFISTSRTSSFHSEVSTSVREVSPTQPKQRTQTPSELLMSGAASYIPPKISMEKNKARLSSHARLSSDYVAEIPSAHRISEPSDGSKGYAESVNDSLAESEDQALRDEFDELMRSGTTLKVSLTPDRLKSMEVYNKEKNRRRSSNKRDAPKVDQHVEPPLPVDDLNRSERVPYLRHVDSIIEDEEYSNTGNLASSMSSAPPSQIKGSAPSPSAQRVDRHNRSRAFSTSHISQTSSNLSRNTSIGSRWKTRPTDLQMPRKAGNGWKAQIDSENMDLDEIMNGSDEERASYKVHSRAETGRTLSTSARDLIDFLDQGPPDAEQRIASSTPSTPASKSKSGKFQRIILRLKGGSSTERLRGEPGVSPRKTASVYVPSTPKGFDPLPQQPYPHYSLPVSKTHPNVIIGTPPRFPQRSNTVAVSPPISSLEEETSVDKSVSPSLQKAKGPRKAVPAFPSVKVDRTPPQTRSRRSSRASESKESLPLASVGPAMSNGHVSWHVDEISEDHLESKEISSSADIKAADDKPIANPIEAVQTPVLTVDHVDEFRRLMSNATTADECRVLVDMFLARVGFPINRAVGNEPYSTATPDPVQETLENTVVEMFLCGVSESKPAPPKQADDQVVQDPRSSSPNVCLPAEAPQAPLDTHPYQKSPRTVAVA